MKAAQETCGKDLPGYFNGVTTLCGRPSGHDAGCWPVPLAGDRKESSDGLSPIAPTSASGAQA